MGEGTGGKGAGGGAGQLSPRCVVYPSSRLLSRPAGTAPHSSVLPVSIRLVSCTMPLGPSPEASYQAAGMLDTRLLSDRSSAVRAAMADQAAGREPDRALPDRSRDCSKNAHKHNVALSPSLGLAEIVQRCDAADRVQ